MAEYSNVGAGMRVLLLLLLVLVLLVGGLLWFDYLGLVNANSFVRPVLRVVGIERPAALPDAEDPFLLDRERMNAREEAIALRAAELDERERQLETREAEIVQVASTLEEQRASLEEQEKSINQARKTYDDRAANLRDIAGKLTSMPPADAVAMLEAMDDVDIIDVIRTTDEIAAVSGTTSITSRWLSDLPAVRAAAISRKMMLGSL
jgi:flagellar protein FlbB